MLTFDKDGFRNLFVWSVYINISTRPIGLGPYDSSKKIYPKELSIIHVSYVTFGLHPLSIHFLFISSFASLVIQAGEGMGE